MTDNILTKLFEHNNWANLRIIEICAKLSDEQLDAKPKSVTKGTIRETLRHLVSSQHGYLSLLTLPVEERTRITPTIGEMYDAAKLSGESLVALAQNEPDKNLKSQLQTTDGFHTTPWVVMLQILNHAHEHREQICSMLNDLDIMPPNMDGWSYGDVNDALVPISK